MPFFASFPLPDWTRNLDLAGTSSTGLVEQAADSMASAGSCIVRSSTQIIDHAGIGVSIGFAHGRCSGAQACEPGSHQSFTGVTAQHSRFCKTDDGGFCWNHEPENAEKAIRRSVESTGPGTNDDLLEYQTVPMTWRCGSSHITERALTLTLKVHFQTPRSTCVGRSTGFESACLNDVC
jgi:hypothetical protein